MASWPAAAVAPWFRCVNGCSLLARQARHFRRQPLPILHAGRRHSGSAHCAAGLWSWSSGLPQFRLSSVRRPNSSLAEMLQTIHWRPSNASSRGRCFSAPLESKHPRTLYLSGLSCVLQPVVPPLGRPSRLGKPRPSHRLASELLSQGLASIQNP